MSGTPPGWYPDAQGVTRWFDGSAWTEHTQDVAPQAPPTPFTAPQSPVPPAQQPYGQQPYGQQPYGAPAGPQRRTGLIAALSGLAVLVVVGAVVGIVLLTGGDDDDTREAGGDTTTSSQPTASQPTAEDPTISAEPVTPPESETSDAAPDPDAPADSPEAVADGFMAAIFAADCDAAEGFASDELLATEGSCGASDIPTGTFDGLAYQIGDAEVTGDTATVTVTVGLAGLGDDTADTATPTRELSLSMERLDGRWQVTDLV